ncbi:hypothetical protein EX30DRAFT_343356 [Ascodesmis nigricans]|uniref:Uncharacterized protein n=1 Tax=Ascodesmis nigricans TaxID=341454 RepID=A0A4S2MRA7_9PEZI|nr:hypothetical protein EX30DRAFT_343356 [Ascodesmis nigricans]
MGQVLYREIASPAVKTASHSSPLPPSSNPQSNPTSSPAPPPSPESSPSSPSSWLALLSVLASSLEVQAAVASYYTKQLFVVYSAVCWLMN